MTGVGANALAELADEVFGSRDTAGSADLGGFDADLWATLEQTGLARLTLPGDVGGSDGAFADAAVVLAAAGAHAARVPLVETDLLAGWLLQAAQIELPAGPLTLASGDLDIARTVRRAAGELHRVPWARAAAGIVVLAGDQVLLIDPADVTVVDGANLAEEPRDTVVVDGPVTASAVEEHVGAQVRLRGALGRSLLLVGALRAALAAAVRYAGEREQFGRPIGRFQAVRAPDRDGQGAHVRGGGCGRPHRPPGARRDRVHPRAPPAPGHHAAVGVARRGRVRGAVAGGRRGGRAGGGPRRAVAVDHGAPLSPRSPVRRESGRIRPLGAPNR
jgi:Acyl-CoA dehydrogenase, C-terminal domain